MKYRFATSFFLLAASTTTFAEESEFEGFYVQGAIGYDAFLAEDNANSEANYFTPLISNARSLSTSNNHHEYADGVAGDLSIGYLYPVGEWFTIGAELGLGILKEDITVSSNDSNSNGLFPNNFHDSSALHTQDTISREALEPTFDLIFGVNPTEDFMIFGLVGMAYNELELTTINTFDYSATAFVQRPQHQPPQPLHAYGFTQSYQQDSNTSVFFRVGLGMLYEIDEDIAFNVTYTFTDYRDLSTQSVDDIIICSPGDGVDNDCDLQGQLTNSSQADVTDNRVLFGINYFL